MILPRFVVLFLFLGVNVGLGLYVTVRALAPRRSATASSRRRLALASLLAVLAVAVTETLARRYAPFGGGAWRPLVWFERVAGLTLLATTLLVVAIHILAPLVFAIRDRLFPTPAPAPDAITRREALTHTLSVAAASVTATATLYGSLRERHDLQVTDVTVTIPELPASLDGLTIVQLTDLHIGIFTGQRELDHMIERTNALRPDLIVLTGDILDNNPAHVRDAMRALSKLRARLGRFAILGNHDHYTSPEVVLRGYADIGLPCLVNRSVSLHTGDPRRGTITLAGVEDVMAPSISRTEGPDLLRALRGRPREAPVVLLAHNPAFFEDITDSVALQLSGHTHGGQINLGGLPEKVLPFVAGRYVRRNSTLYVSRGIGITGAPVRLRAAPEIVRIGLTGRRT